MLHLIWKNLVRNRRRNLLTVLSIAFSMLILITLQTVLTEIKQISQTDPRNLRLYIRQANSWFELLPSSYEQRISKAPGVTKICAWTQYSGVYRDESEILPTVGIDPEPFLDMYTEIHIPPDQAMAFLNSPNGAIANQNLATRHGWTLGETIILKGNSPPVDLELIIAGIFTSDVVDNTLYFDRKYLDQAMGDWGKVGGYWVEARSSEVIPEIIKHVDSIFHNSSFPTKTVAERAVTLEFLSWLGNINLLIGVVSSIVLFTILMVVGNTMAMSVREKRREMGILRSLGFRSRQILVLIVGEGLALALTGWLFGCLGGKLIYALIPRTLMNQFEIAIIWGLCGVAVTVSSYLLIGKNEFSPSLTAWHRTVPVSLLIGMAGFIIGSMFYLFASNMINASPLLYGFKVTVETVSIGLIAAVVLGLVSSTVPALRAMRLSVAEALRTLG